MKRKIRVNSKTHLAYIPEEVINEGFVGDLDAYKIFGSGWENGKWK